MNTSQPSASSDPLTELREAIARECSRLEEDSLYSAKGSFEAAKRWGHVHLMVGIPTALIAAVAGVSAFNDYPEFAGVLAVLVAALSSISTFLNPSEKAQAFSQAGNRYNALRARARFLREVTGRTAATPEEQAAELKEILAEKEKVSQESPIISRPAFERARKGIEAGEDLRSRLEDIPSLFLRHVPQARQMLRKLLNGHILCEPIMENGKTGYRFTATGTFDRLLTGLTVANEPANVFGGGQGS